MPLPKLKNSLSVKLALYSVLQIRKLVFSFGNCIQKTVSETCVKWSRFGAVSETRGLTLKLAQCRSNFYNAVFDVILNQPNVLHF